MTKCALLVACLQKHVHRTRLKPIIKLIIIIIIIIIIITIITAFEWFQLASLLFMKNYKICQMSGACRMKMSWMEGGKGKIETKV